LLAQQLFSNRISDGIVTEMGVANTNSQKYNDLIASTVETHRVLHFESVAMVFYSLNQERLGFKLQKG